jgi:hypothetical protein
MALDLLCILVMVEHSILNPNKLSWTSVVTHTTMATASRFGAVVAHVSSLATIVAGSVSIAVSAATFLSARFSAVSAHEADMKRMRLDIIESFKKARPDIKLKNYSTPATPGTTQKKNEGNKIIQETGYRLVVRKAL